MGENASMEMNLRGAVFAAPREIQKKKCATFKSGPFWIGGN